MKPKRLTITLRDADVATLSEALEQFTGNAKELLELEDNPEMALQCVLAEDLLERLDLARQDLTT